MASALRGVIAAVEGLVCGDGGDLAFEPDGAVAVGLGGTGGGDDTVHEAGVADGPLEGLLRAHREADDSLEVFDMEIAGEELMDRGDVVANGHDWEARAVEGLGCVRGRGRTAVAEELCGDEEELVRIEGFAGADEEAVAFILGHVVRVLKEGVFASSVKVAVGAVEDVGFGQDSAAFGVEVTQDEFVRRRLWILWGRSVRLGDAGAEESEGKCAKNHRGACFPAVSSSFTI